MRSVVLPGRDRSQKEQCQQKKSLSQASVYLTVEGTKHLIKKKTNKREPNSYELPFKRIDAWHVMSCFERLCFNRDWLKTHTKGNLDWTAESQLHGTKWQRTKPQVNELLSVLSRSYTLDALLFFIHGVFWVLLPLVHLELFQIVLEVRGGHRYKSWLVSNG